MAGHAVSSADNPQPLRRPWSARAAAFVMLGETGLAVILFLWAFLPAQTQTAYGFLGPEITGAVLVAAITFELVPALFILRGGRNALICAAGVQLVASLMALISVVLLLPFLVTLALLVHAITHSGPSPRGVPAGRDKLAWWLALVILIPQCVVTVWNATSFVDGGRSAAAVTAVLAIAALGAFVGGSVWSRWFFVVVVVLELGMTVQMVYGPAQPGGIGYFAIIGVPLMVALMGALNFDRLATRLEH